jgi:hypothetical protein
MSHIVYGEEHAINLFENPDLQVAMEADTAFQDSRLLSPFVILPAFFPRLTLFLRRRGLAPLSISGKTPSNLVSDRLGREALAALKSTDKGPSALIQGPEPLIARLYFHLNTQGPSSGVPSEEYVLSDGLDHFWAGVSTTLDALVPLIHHLSQPKNRGKQERLRQELMDADRGVGMPEQDLMRDVDLKKLNYLDAVIRETLRLNPPIPVSLARSAGEEELDICGHRISKGTVVGASPLVVGRDPAVYDCPDQWVPERWIRSDESSGEGEATEKAKLLEMRRCFFAFGAGPRICLGVNVAWTIMRALIAGIAGNFETEVVPHTNKEWAFGPAEEKISFKRLCRKHYLD